MRKLTPLHRSGVRCRRHPDNPTSRVLRAQNSTAARLVHRTVQRARFLRSGDGQRTATVCPRKLVLIGQTFALIRHVEHDPNPAANHQPLAS
jgi:hypothetical protein